RLALGGEAFGFGARAGDDGLGLTVGFLPLALVLGEQGLRLFAQPARFLELGLDACLALVDPVDHPAMRAGVDHDAEKQQESDGNPGFSFEHETTPYCLITSPKAAATSCAAGVLPISRSTIAAAVSAAMLRTLAMAAVRFSAIERSAAASRSCSCASR